MQLTLALRSAGPAALVLLFTLGCGGLGSRPWPKAPECATGQVACGQRCVNLSTDPANCGGCGIPCPSGQACRDAVCRCEEGVLCNGACVAPTLDVCTNPAPTLVTSGPGDYWNTAGQLRDVLDGAVDVTVDDAAQAQTWEGFGGSFNELGWYYLSLLSPSERDLALHLLYGADGARFSFGRIPIGASDYAMDRYTLDETAGDTTLAAFSIARDTERLIPFIQAAQAVRSNIRFWASPWTPPTWMKEGPFSPGNVVSPFDGGSMRSDDAALDAFARYLVAFVQAYAQQGIAIEAISPQNEPSYTGNYPTCGWTPSTYVRLVGQHLGPAIASAGLATKIMLGTFNGGASDRDIVDTVLSDSVASRYVDVLGFQWGMLSAVAGAKVHRLPIWETEHKCGNYPWEKPFDAGAAPNDQAYAVESWGLLRDWIRAGVTAYSAWNMVLDTGGVGIDTTRVWPQNALLTVDVATRRLAVTPTYYVFRHISQFVPTGSKVVGTRGGDALAFKTPDGGVVAVLRNAGPPRPITLAMAGRTLNFQIPGDGWASVALPPPHPTMP